MALILNVLKILQQQALLFYMLNRIVLNRAFHQFTRILLHFACSIANSSYQQDVFPYVLTISLNYIVAVLLLSAKAFAESNGISNQ